MRHILVLEGVVGLIEHQRENWHHVIKKVFLISKNDKLEIVDKTDLANDLIMNVLTNIKIMKKFYNSYFISRIYPLFSRISSPDYIEPDAI